MLNAGSEYLPTGFEAEPGGDLIRKVANGLTARARREARGGHPSNWIRPEKRLAIYLRDKFRCLYCLTDLSDTWSTKGSGGHGMISLDHLVTREEGGSNDASNVITCCLSCNCRRKTMRWTSFARLIANENNMSETEADKVISRIRNATRRKLNVTLAKALIRDRQRTDVRKAEAVR